MASYASKTVAQLKELLKSQGLSTNGVKSDLISRLEEADAEKEQSKELEEVSAEKVEAEKPEEAKEESKEEPEPKEEDAPKEDASKEETPSKKAEAEPPKEEEPTVKKMTTEELNTSVTELLKKKIERAKRFGNDETAISDLEKQLKRISKFGVSPESYLAREVGYTTGKKTVKKADKGKVFKPKSKKNFRKP